MATFQVQAPDGSIHEIQGPDNATPEQVIQQAQQLIPQQPAAPGIIDRIGTDWKKRGQNISDIAGMQDAGTQSLPENTVQTMGQLAGGLNDVVGEGVKGALNVGDMLTPDFYKDAMKGTADAVYNSRPMRDMRGAGQEIEQFEKANPRAGRNLDAVTNLVTAAPIIGAGIDMAKAAPGAFKGGMEGLKDALATNKKPVLTSDNARRIGGEDFEAVTRGGHVFPENFSNKYADAVQEHLPQDAVDEIVSGDAPINEFGKNLQDLRGQKMTIQNVMKLDTKLGEMVDKFTENGNLKAEGLPFAKLQDKLRDLVRTEPDVSEQLSRARANWADSYKLRDIERINSHAENMVNPAQARQNGFRQLAKNENKFPTYTPQQQEWINKAAKSSFTNDFIRGLGYRLNAPAAAMATTAAAGPIAGAAVYGGTALMSKGARKLADYLQSIPGNKLAGSISDDIMERMPDYVPPGAATPAAPLGLPAPDVEFSADSFGNVQKMSPVEKLAAAMKRQQASDIGLTPDVSHNVARQAQRSKNAAGFEAADKERMQALMKALRAKMNAEKVKEK